LHFKFLQRLRLTPAFIILSLLTACTVQQTSRQDENPPFLSLLTASGSSSVSSGTPVAARDPGRNGATFDIGPEDAPALLLFTNHACAYCRQFQEQILPRLKADFIDKGKLRLQTAILPINKYPLSGRETAALACAQAQGKGEQMHAALFALRDHTEAELLAAVQALAMKMEEFTACLSSPQTAALVQTQADLAAERNVTLVPTLFFGEEKQTGLPRYADLRGWIESGLDD